MKKFLCLALFAGIPAVYAASSATVPEPFFKLNPQPTTQSVTPSQGAAIASAPVDRSSLQIGGSEIVTTSTAKMVDYTVTLTNSGPSPIEVTHIGSSPSNLMALAKPLSLKPKESSTREFTALSFGMRQGADVTIFAVEKGPTGPLLAYGHLKVRFSDIPAYSSQFLLWREGELATEKSIEVKLPVGVSINSIAPLPGFTTRTVGSTIFVKPSDTKTKTHVAMMVSYKPAKQVGSIMPVMVMIQ